MQNYKESQDKAGLFKYSVELGLDLDLRLGVRRLKEEISKELVKLGMEDKVVNTKVKEERINIIIHKTPGVTGSGDVQVSVNAVVYLIKRGVKVSVPKSVVEVLNNAIKTEYTFVGEGQPLDENEVLSYPFSYT